MRPTICSVKAARWSSGKTLGPSRSSAETARSGRAPLSVTNAKNPIEGLCLGGRLRGDLEAGPIGPRDAVPEPVRAVVVGAGLQEFLAEGIARVILRELVGDRTADLLLCFDGHARLLLLLPRLVEHVFEVGHPRARRDEHAVRRVEFPLLDFEHLCDVLGFGVAALAVILGQVERRAHDGRELGDDEAACTPLRAHGRDALGVGLLGVGRVGSLGLLPLLDHASALPLPAAFGSGRAGTAGRRRSRSSRHGGAVRGEALRGLEVGGGVARVAAFATCLAAHPVMVAPRVAKVLGARGPRVRRGIGSLAPSALAALAHGGSSNTCPARPASGGSLSQMRCFVSKPHTHTHTHAPKRRGGALNQHGYGGPGTRIKTNTIPNTRTTTIVNMHSGIGNMHNQSNGSYSY